MDRPNLGNVPLFGGLSPEDRSFLQDRLEEVSVAPGASLVVAEAPADRVFILTQGWVRLLTSRGHELARLGPGSVVGEADALSGATYSVQVEAITQVRAWVLRVETVRELVRRYPASMLALDSALGFRAEAASEGFADWLGEMEEFRSVSREELGRLAGSLEPLSLEPGEEIGIRSQSGFAVVERGDVEVLDQALGPVLRGGCFLFLDRSLLAGGAPSTQGRVVSPTLAWYLPAATCDRLKREGLVVLNELIQEAIEQEPLIEAALTTYVPETLATEPVVVALPIRREPAVVAPEPAGLSAGAKGRLALGVLLLLWVLALGAISVWRSLSANAADLPTRDLSQFRGTAVALTPVAFAQDIAATPTFAPSATPQPTSTAAPTDTPVPPTATVVPTDTPEPTATSVPPTAVPPTPVPAQADTTAGQAEVVAAPPPPVDTPVPATNPGVDYQVVSWRQLTPCENHGMHNIFINVVDPAGNGIPGVPLYVTWGGDGVQVVTGDKPDMGPGYAVFDMFKGTYWVNVAQGTSETSPPLTVDIGEDQLCTETGNPVGNSLYHYSYEVTFQRTW